jgi:metallophosphoesterase superfamily enzyme
MHGGFKPSRPSLAELVAGHEHAFAEVSSGRMENALLVIWRIASEPFLVVQQLELLGQVSSQ